MRDFRSLQVWARAHQLALNIYEITDSYPKSETYGLTSQIRRSAISIPTNIAEGCGKDSPAEFVRYLIISMGSASELEYLLLLSYDLDYLSCEKYQMLVNDLIEVRKMLNAYTQKVKITRDGNIK